MSENYTVKLGNYKGITYPKTDISVDPKDIEAFIAEELERNATYTVVEERAKEGDQVNLNYAGFLGEEQFQGGTAENADLVLGSHTFIPGFEEQLIGTQKGDSVDVNVSFPAQYHAPDLAGKAVVFKCTINSVSRKSVPVLNDEYVSSTYGMKDVAAFNDAVYKTLQGEAMQKAQNNAQDVVLGKLADICEVEITEDYLQFCLDRQFAMMQQQMRQQGFGVEEYCQALGLTVEALRSQLRPQAEKTAKITAIMETICEMEAVFVTEQELTAELTLMGQSYGMNAEQVKGAIGENGLAEIEKNLALTKALNLVMDLAVEE